MEEVIELIRNDDDTIRSNKEMENTRNSTGATINYVGRKKGGKKHYTNSSLSSQNSTSSSENSHKCYRCGKPYKNYHICKVKDAICNVCKKKGHYEAACRKAGKFPNKQRKFVNVINGTETDASSNSSNTREPDYYDETGQPVWVGNIQMIKAMNTISGQHS